MALLRGTAAVALAVVASLLGGGHTNITARASTQMGIDVSQFQGAINWGAVAASGISFAYIRASDGAGYPYPGRDTTFVNNWDGAVQNGVLPGAYLYFHPNQDPIAQGQTLIAALQQVDFGPGSMVPAIDIEETDGQSPPQIVAALHQVIDYVQSTIGALPAIYTSPGQWSSNEGNSLDFTADPLWNACWCSGSPTVAGNNWGGFGYQIWQYSDSGGISGIGGRVDLDQGTPPMYSGTSSTGIQGPPNAPAGQPVTATATVSSSQAGGAVTFTLNGSALSGCTRQPLAGGRASCRTTSLSAGTQRIAAYYSSGGNTFSSAAGYSIVVQSTAWPGAQGSPSQAQNSDGQLLNFWRGTNDHIYETWSGSSGGWSGPVDWTAQWGAGGIASTPTVVEAPSGQTFIFWQGDNSHLWQAWYTPGSGWAGPVDWSAQWGGGLITSPPTVLFNPEGQTLIFWRGQSNHLFQAWYTPGTGWAGPVDWSAQWGVGGVQSQPTVVISPQDQTLVFWEGTNGQLLEAWYTMGSGWAGPVNWTAQWGGG
ncbi:MAG: Ig-like domain repeat protein, partial [Streptomyces sp.]|nr:Ig-like domain repeat protein [Streptomyces sp.]